MYPLSDQELDRISREAAEQYDIEPGASGWEQLEKHLNSDLPVQSEKKRNWFTWILFLILFLSGGGLTWILVADHTPSKPVLQKSIPASTDVSNEKITPKGSGKNLQSNENPENSAESPAISDLKKSKDISTVPDNSGRLVEFNPAIRRSKNNTDPLKSGKKFPAGEGQFLKKTAWLQKNSLAGNSRQEKPSGLVSPKLSRESSSGVQPEDYSNPGMANLTGRSISPNSLLNPGYKKPNTENALAKEFSPAVESSLQTTSATRIGSRFRKKVSIGVLLGPDVSTIHSSPLQKPGFNTGITMELLVSRRWSVGTGFIITHKNYQAKGADYHPPQHYWTNYVKLEKLDGDCNMWEIPVYVRYNLNIHSNRQWFLTTGLSSYIMRSQFYEYYYYQNNGTPAQKTWTNKSQENYWFPVLNFSGGYQRFIGSRLSLQAEPFLKIPMKGIGFGNMNINSYGVYFGLKYTTGRSTGLKK